MDIVLFFLFDLIHSFVVFAIFVVFF